MLNSVNHLKNFVLLATDGDIGRVKDLYFDDDAWTIRYFVVDTGSWLESRKVLISPISLQPPKWPDRSLPVSITRAQIKNSPSFDTDEPVSRQNEEQFMGHYGYPYYWDGHGIWGEGLYPYTLFPGNAATRGRVTETTIRICGVAMRFWATTSVPSMAKLATFQITSSTTIHGRSAI